MQTIGIVLILLVAIACGVIIRRTADTRTGVAAGALVMVGGWFWVTSPDRERTRAELGRTLLFGLAASIGIFYVQAGISERLREQDLHLTISQAETLVGIQLRDRDLTDAYLVGKDLRKANLVWSDLRGTNLSSATLTEAILVDVNLQKANLTRAHLNEARLSGADLRKARLFSTDFRHACFAAGELSGKRYEAADLRGARLAGADLAGANFAGADLRGALFEEDLREAKNMDTAIFIGARVGDTTKWPAGFEPQLRLQPGAPTVEKGRIPRPTRLDVVESVTDGDTLLLRELGKARLHGLDAPSRDTTVGRRAVRFTRDRLPPGTRVFGQSVKVDEYGRHQVLLWMADGRLFNEMLVAASYAKVNVDGPGESVGRLGAAQERARASAQGVWGTCSF
jgi:uncharacterized protein YjbI with pentapeptide repeats